MLAITTGAMYLYMLDGSWTSTVTDWLALAGCSSLAPTHGPKIAHCGDTLGSQER